MMASKRNMRRRVIKSFLPIALALPTNGQHHIGSGELYAFRRLSSSSRMTNLVAFCPASRSTKLTRFFSSSSSFLSSKGVEEERGKKLAENLRQSKYANIVVVLGAGASTAAGIPDFRTPGSGLYARLQEYDLPFPESIFDLAYYRENPAPFCDLATSMWPGQKEGPKPTLSHAFLKLLEEKGCLRRVYTQNIDGLESLAGLEDKSLVECHGHFRGASCISCHTKMDSLECKETIFQNKIPRCNKCGNLVKPDIVFFGEELPQRFQQIVEQDVRKCDLLFVLGTSLQVMPVAAIPSWVSRDCPRALLNLELVGDFKNRDNDRDVFLQGNCDDSVMKLCQMAGWENNLVECYQNVR